MRAPSLRRTRAGFTLLELATVILVIAILATLLIPALEQVKERVEKVNCTNNIRQLYTGASSYMQEYGHWPQVNPALLQQPNHAYDEAWIEDFLPFAIDRGTWICPTIQRQLGAPDYTQKENYRTDYLAMPFDGKPRTPYQWPTAPWFVERGNVHGNGNLVIQSNGAVVELVTSNPASSSSPTP
jgi:prepilin-type N-terminal cleavage/methylation domain-containing protein